MCGAKAGVLHSEPAGRLRQGGAGTHLDVVAVVYEQVEALDVPMDDPPAVDVLQPQQRLDEVLPDLRLGQARARGALLLQQAAAHGVGRLPQP